MRPSRPSRAVRPSRAPRPLRRDLTVFVLALVALLAGAASCEVTPSPAPGGSAAGTPGSGAVTRRGGAAAPATVDPAEIRAELAALPVAAAHAMKGYSRDRFPHWISQSAGCDTRDVVLQRDGTDVKVTGACKIVSGNWYSAYDDRTYTDPQQVDIDHMVPLANAWRSGADTWDDTRRSAFANDLTRPQLIAVSRTTNRAKGDQDPSQWRPPNRGYWCRYAESWIIVKHAWQLTVTQPEKTKLAEMLEAC